MERDRDTAPDAPAPPGLALTDEYLAGALVALEGRMGDERFAGELYRALANRVWTTAAGQQVSLSWTRAAAVVDALRERAGHAHLGLAQTGGEGQVAELVGEDLARLGWTSRALHTSEHEAGHDAEAAGPPPPDAGERHAPAQPPEEWRRARDEAQADRDPEPP